MDKNTYNSPVISTLIAKRTKKTQRKHGMSMLLATPTINMKKTIPQVKNNNSQVPSLVKNEIIIIDDSKETQAEISNKEDKSPLHMGELDTKILDIMEEILKHKFVYFHQWPLYLKEHFPQFSNEPLLKIEMINHGKGPAFFAALFPQSLYFSILRLASVHMIYFQIYINEESHIPGIPSLKDRNDADKNTQHLIPLYARITEDRSQLDTKTILWEARTHTRFVLKKNFN